MILNDILLEKISQISGIHRFLKNNLLNVINHFFSTEDFHFSFWVLVIR